METSVEGAAAATAAGLAFSVDLLLLVGLGTASSSSSKSNWRKEGEKRSEVQINNSRPLFRLTKLPLPRGEVGSLVLDMRCSGARGVLAVDVAAEAGKEGVEATAAPSSALETGAGACGAEETVERRD